MLHGKPHGASPGNALWQASDSRPRAATLRPCAEPRAHSGIPGEIPAGGQAASLGPQGQGHRDRPPVHNHILGIS